MALRTPNKTGRPLAWVVNPASDAKITTANTIDVNFLLVEIEMGTNAVSIMRSTTAILTCEKE
jgi:hypothetical protein